MTSRRFIITGLPRSRTAWLALFMSCGDTICYHEPENLTGGDIDQAMAMIFADEHECVGISDSTIPARLATVKAVFPCSKVVIVNRDQDDALASFCGFTKMPYSKTLPYFEKLKQGLGEITHYFPDVLNVEFTDLSNLATLRTIWEFCCHTESFDDARATVFNAVICNQKLPT